MLWIKPVHVAIEEFRKGVQEVPLASNCGPRVDVYNRSLGMYAVPWCATFVFWCFSEASRRNGRINAFPRSGYCPYVQDWATRQKAWVTLPEQGDLFLLIGRDGLAYHVGFVDVPRSKYFTTVEGNSNGLGSPEGHALCQNRRGYSHSVKFFRGPI